MATLDGFSPYGCGMSAQHAVEALWRAHGLPDTLKEYYKLYEQEKAPLYDDVDSGYCFWFNTVNKKLYKGIKNKDLSLIIFFEV